MHDDREQLKVIGLMSGTSVDGIDACLVTIQPDLALAVAASLVYPYPDNVQHLISQAITGQAGPREICQLNFLVGEYFAQAALEVIKQAGLRAEQVDLIGSHGQTIYHCPEPSCLNHYPLTSTLQIGEPSIIAQRTGITTIADFRPGDIAAGGQGAPLVCFADEVIFRKTQENVAVQNLGGIGNVTVVSQVGPTFAFDTGPGNVLIDHYTRKFFSLPFDEGGRIAAAGKIDTAWLDLLLEDEYYRIRPPKTTGREKFSAVYAEKMLAYTNSPPSDIIATATALTAQSIAKAYQDFVYPRTTLDQVILGGGGVYNGELVKYLREFIPQPTRICRHEDFGISDEIQGGDRVRAAGLHLVLWNSEQSSGLYWSPGKGGVRENGASFSYSGICGILSNGHKAAKVFVRNADIMVSKASAKTPK